MFKKKIIIFSEYSKKIGHGHLIRSTRIFDILKPWPASYADKKMDGGLGVMLDDVFAGIYTAILIYLIGYII